MKNRAFRRTSLRYPVANYADIVRAGWHLWRDRPALVFRGQSLTYGELDAASRAFSGQLQATGFQPGDVAVLWLGNTPGCLAAVLGTLAAGGVVLPQHVAAPPPEVADRIGATDASLLVVDAVRDRAEAAAASGGTPATLLSVPNLGDDIGERPRGEVPADTGAASRTAPSGSDLALLPFSSGTTGLPKGVHLSHANLVAGLFQFADAIDIGANDRLVHFVPLSHIYGLMVAGAALANGASLVLQERYAFDDVVADVERHRATMLFGVSQVIVDLVAQASGIAGAFDSLRFVNTGSAPLAAEVMRELERETGIMVTVGYGLTEAAPACHAPVTSPHLIDLETVGYPVADTKLRFVHPDNPAREVGADEEGELLIQGPQVAGGYWNAPEETIATWHNGWLRTGDLARLDASGQVRIVGRLKSLIKFKGYSVAPAELEAILASHPAVADCAVIGRPDASAGEVPTAYIVLRPESLAGAEDLKQFVDARVAPYKRVRSFEFVDAIPRNRLGKLDLDALTRLEDGG